MLDDDMVTVSRISLKRLQMNLAYSKSSLGTAESKIKSLEDGGSTIPECDTCNPLIVSERVMRDDINAAMSIGKTSVMDIQYYAAGAANYEGYVSKEESDELDAKYIYNPSFYPYCIDYSFAKASLVLNKKDRMYLELVKRFGDRPYVLKGVLRAKEELIEYNPSGHTPVMVLLDDNGNKMSVSGLCAKYERTVCSMQEKLEKYDKKFDSMKGEIERLKRTDHQPTERTPRNRKRGAFASRTRISADVRDADNHVPAVTLTVHSVTAHNGIVVTGRQ
jgi:hypothetical protein